MNRRMFICAANILNGGLAVNSANVSAGVLCSPYTASGVQFCDAGIDSSVIAVNAQIQNASQWCWAACIQIVFQYYGYRISQQRIVAETWGQILNLPAQPQQILADLNRSWQSDNGSNFYAQGDVFTANPITAAQDLAQDMPLIIGTMGHAMVLTSIKYQRDAYGRGIVHSATVRDPWPNNGRRILSPQEWFSTNFLVRIRVT